MAFVPVPFTALFEFRFLVFGQRIENTLWFTNVNEDVWSEQQALDMTNEALTHYNTVGKTLVASDTVFTEIVVTDMSSSTAPQWTFPMGDIVGTHTGASLPLNATYTIRFRTNGRGRSSRGRNYVPSLPEGEVVGNTVGTAFAGDWIDYYSDLAQVMVSPGINSQHVVVSRFEDGAERTSGLVQAVTSYTVADFFVDSQRRRLSGRGL
jgi:hypothetical protein